MSGGIYAVKEHVRDTLLNCGWGVSYGLAVGSAAGFLATALKVSKAISFINLGIAFAAGLGAYWLLKHAIGQLKFVQETAWLRELVNHIVLPTLSVLAAIYATNYASLGIYTIVAVGAGAFLLGNWLQPTSLPRPVVV
jgi:hypothetical protein